MHVFGILFIVFLPACSKPSYSGEIYPATEDAAIGKPLAIEPINACTSVVQDFPNRY
jgi:hypothetical protein